MGLILHFILPLVLFSPLFPVLLAVRKEGSCPWRTSSGHDQGQERLGCHSHQPQQAGRPLLPDDEFPRSKSFHRPRRTLHESCCRWSRWSRNCRRSRLTPEPRGRGCGQPWPQPPRPSSLAGPWPSLPHSHRTGRADSSRCSSTPQRQYIKSTGDAAAGVEDNEVAMPTDFL